MLLDIKKKMFPLRERFNFTFRSSVLIEGLIYTSNFGDYLNYPLVEFLSRRSVVSPKFLKTSSHISITKYSVIGSIIHCIPEGSVVWGSGLISNVIEFPKNLDVRSVRGPLTRDILIKAGIECPEIYGDPALLLPLFYYPSVKKEYRVGVLPHVVDKYSPFLDLFDRVPNAKIFDINCGVKYKRLVREILKCNFLVTSSLHGIIIAIAYKVPYVWVNFSNNLIGGDFKFRDFFLSIGKPNEIPVQFTDNTTIEYLESKVDYTHISIDLLDLIKSCPFIDEGVERQLLRKLDYNF